MAGAITLELFNRVWIERVWVNAQLPNAAIQVHLKNETSHTQNCIVRVQDIARTDISAETICVLTPGSQICELTAPYSNIVLYKQCTARRNAIIYHTITITEQRNGIAVFKSSTTD